MELIIGEALTEVKVNKANSFEVVIETMTGDGDIEHFTTVGPFLEGEDEDALASLLGVLERLITATPDKWVADTNTTVEGFIGWFGEEVIAPYNEEMFRRYYRRYEFFDSLEETVQFAQRIIARNNGNHFNWAFDITQDYVHTEYVEHKVF